MKRFKFRLIVVGAVLVLLGSLIVPLAQAGGRDPDQKIEYNFKGNKQSEISAKSYRLTCARTLGVCRPVLDCTSGHGLDFKFFIVGAPIKIKNDDFDRLKISGKKQSQTLKGDGVWGHKLNTSNPYICVGVKDTRKYNIEEDFVVWIKP